MSRLIVKNLPSTITENKFRKTFSSQGGEVTDVQLKYTKEGTFRHFGFVGFKTEEGAQKAKKYFNGTYIGATKVSVEICADLGDSINKPRAWSKYASDSSAYQTANETKQDLVVDDEKAKAKKDKKTKKKEKQAKVDALLEKYKDDHKFQEFLRIHERNSIASATWNNDAILQVGKSYEETDHTADGNIVEELEQPVLSEDDENQNVKVALDKKVSDLDYLKSLSNTNDLENEKEKKEVIENSNKKAKENKKQKEPKNETFFTVKLSGLPFKAKKKDVKKFFNGLKPKSIRVPPKIKGIAYAGFATEKEWKNALNRNKSFMGSSQICVMRYDKQRTDITAETTQEKWKKQEDGIKNEESVGESGRIFIRNLSYSVTEEDIESLFKKFGPLAEVTLPIDKMTRKVKGFAFVTYVMPENAVKAYTQLDGATFQGRLLHLIPGKAKLSSEELADKEGIKLENGTSSFKKKKLSKEKSKAESAHNWNTLFLGSSAVADLMADRYSVSKQDVLTNDTGQQSAAVRLALGETQIVADTRNFLEEQGVILDAFSQPPSKRSKTVLLIKNLPVKTPIEEIRDMFAKHGELGRVVLPPNGITALVEFYEPSEAKTAFRRLAYTKYKSAPLYLEWAPDGAFRPKDKRLVESERPSNTTWIEDRVGEQSTAESQQEVNLPPEENTILFVKNLNFETTDEELKSHFEQNIGDNSIYSATISRKKNPKKPGETLSMGYGFVQFYKYADAEKALKVVQGKRLHEHCLELKRSNRGGQSLEDNESAQNKSSVRNVLPSEVSTKLLVRNVPFEATSREVEDIFKTFGSLKGVRLPKKVTGSHRGFAFIDFHSKEEAKKAFEALCHRYCY